MGKVWPPGSIALHESTTPLTNIVSIDESPLLEGLIIVGTDDGLVQITEDGGKTWREVEDFPGRAEVGVRDRRLRVAARRERHLRRVQQLAARRLQAVRRRAATIAASTWTNITGNLPDKHDVWAIAQDHINADLLFAGTEFGLFFTVDGGRKWVQLKGGMPPTQVRDLQLQKRESDVVMATFGRGFWILDDYSPLREVSAQTLGEEARLFPLRHAYQFTPWGVAQDRLGGPRDARRQLHDAESAVRRRAHVSRARGAAGGHAARREHHRQQRPAGAPDRARQDAGSPSHRVEPDGRGGRGVQARRSRSGDRRSERGDRSRSRRPPQGQAQAGGAAPAGRRSGRSRRRRRAVGAAAAAAAPPVEPGRYRVEIGKLVGETFTPIGPPQVVPGDHAAGEELPVVPVTEHGPGRGSI